MRILVLGGSGQLGQDLIKEFSRHRVFAPDHHNLDIANEQRVIDVVGSIWPQVVINTAAVHDLPRCESEPQHAFAVNSLGVKYLAAACRQVKARFIQISTDYVFDGEQESPYVESDNPKPLMVYGATKLAGEHFALSECPKSYIIRTCGLFGKAPCRGKPSGRNFIQTMLHLAHTRDQLQVVDDQLCCPTYTRDLARWIKSLLESRAEPGIYHAVNGPGVSWYDFACQVLSRARIRTPIKAVASNVFPSVVRRPADTRLASCQFASPPMRPLQDALVEYMECLEDRDRKKTNTGRVLPFVARSGQPSTSEISSLV